MVLFQTMTHRGVAKSQPPGYSFASGVYDMFQVIFVFSGELLFSGDRHAETRPNVGPQTVGPGEVLVLRLGSRFTLSSPISGYGGVGYLEYEPADPRQRGHSYRFRASDWLVQLAAQMQFALTYPESCSQETVTLLGRAMALHSLDEGPARAGLRETGARRGELERLWAERVRYLVQNTLYAERSEFSRGIDALGLSYRQLARHFRSHAGMSIKQYQIAERIREARRLLRGTDLSVTDIAAELHYASSQKFASQFRQVTGMTPGEYRRG